MPLGCELVPGVVDHSVFLKAGMEKQVEPSITISDILIRGNFVYTRSAVRKFFLLKGEGKSKLYAGEEPNLW